MHVLQTNLLIAVVKKVLCVSAFSIMLEEDGSLVSDDVLAAKLEDGKCIVTVMVLCLPEHSAKGVTFYFKDHDIL